MPTAAATPTSSPSTAAHLGLMVILVPVLVSTVVTLAAVGGGAFWLLHSGKFGGSTTSTTPVPPAVASHVMALEPMIVNLADGRSYLRAGVSLRVSDEIKVEKKEGSTDPRATDSGTTALRDTTLSVLSSSTADALLAPDGRESLKKALQGAYRQHNKESHVLDVYFTEFLVQRG